LPCADVGPAKIQHETNDEKRDKIDKN
jgi:hypothetical protein